MTSNGYNPEDYRRDIEDIRDGLGEAWAAFNAVEDVSGKIDNLEQHQSEIIDVIESMGAKLNELTRAVNNNSERLQRQTDALVKLLDAMDGAQLRPKEPPPPPPPSAPIPFTRKPKPKGSKP